MKITELLFGPRRPGRRKVRRQAAAIRAKTPPPGGGSPTPTRCSRAGKGVPDDRTFP